MSLVEAGYSQSLPILGVSLHWNAAPLATIYMGTGNVAGTMQWVHPFVSLHTG